MTQVSVTVTRCDDANENHHYLLSQSSGPIRIGRSPANHVKVEFRGISAYHLELRAGLDNLDNGLVRACDLSMNGTTFELPGGEKIALQKGVETSIPDGAKLLIPAKVKREEGQSQDRVSYLVRWHRTQPKSETAEDDRETPAFSSVAAKTRLGVDSSSRPAARSESSESDEDNGAPLGKTLNGSTPHPSDVPVPESKLPALGIALNKKKGTAEASSPTNSDSLEQSPPAQPTPTIVSSIAGTQLRPKAQPKRPAITAVERPKSAAANDSSSNSSKEKASKKGAQKSRSRSGGQSKSRGRGRGRQRKRSRSGSNSRSRKRRRKRKRSKSRGGKRKRRRSKSQSSSGSKSDDGDDKAPSAPAAGNPIPGMQQAWGMPWGAQPAWGWNPYMQGSVQPQMSVDMIKQQIYFMYQRFKPEKLPEYENILKKYKGSEYELLQAMCSKYMSGANAAPPGGGAPQ